MSLDHPISQKNRANRTYLSVATGRLVVIGAIASAIALCAPAPCSAAISFTVDDSADLVDENPGDGICKASEHGCTLRAAISEANALAQPSGELTIYLPDGTFTLALPGTGENLNASGDLDIRSNLTLIGAGTEATIINAAGLDRVFDIAVHYPALQVEMTNLTITGGAPPTAGDDKDHSGGGIYSYGNLTLTGVKVTNNTSANGNNVASHFDSNIGCVVDVDASPGGAGGGIYNGETLNLVNSEVSFNATGWGGSQDQCWYFTQLKGTGTPQSGGAGGGIYNGYDSTLILENSSVVNNHTGYGGTSYHYGDTTDPGDGGPGGGIYGFYPAVFQLSNSTVSANWTGKGGSRYPDSSILEGRCLDNDCPAGFGGDGGGIECESDPSMGTITITGSTIADNYTGLPGGYCSVCSPGAAGEGGGMYTWGDATVAITTSTISGNTASGGFDEQAVVRGGGLFIYGGNLTITSSTISGNKAPFAGGLFHYGSQDYAGVVRDSTFTLNKAYRGGGIAWVGLTSWNEHFTIGNTIVAGNTATNVGNDCYTVYPDDDTLKIASYGYNLIGDTGNCGFAAASGDHLNVPAQLRPLADNGGPTFTHLLGPSSLAFDNGGGCLSSDQRGVARPQGLQCDVGAVEGRSTSVTPTGAINEAIFLLLF